MNKIKNLEVPPGSKTVSFEVSALFTSIPIDYALKAAKQPRDRTCPPDIRHSKRDLTDLAFHPEKNLIATALIDGEWLPNAYGNQY